MPTVIESTVASGFCCGCGVCAGICPSHNLKIEWNKYGEYNPVKISECKTECELCLKVCPFADGNDNEDEIGKKVFALEAGAQHRTETGYYISSGVGAVSDEKRRMSSSSGGLATWFLAELLTAKYIDAVICVGNTTGDKLFSFFVAKTADDIYSATGSAYYPAEVSGVLQYVKEHPRRYAVIGLPCVLKGIRLAQERFSYLRESLIVLVGLACSNLKSSHFVEYAGYRAGLSEKIGWCRFRHKSYDLPRNFFKLQFIGVNRTKVEIDWGGTNQLWKMYLGRCLTIHACDCCDDMHAECADITFMDAWLPEYNNEPRGTSLWIARTKFTESVMQKGLSDGVLDVSPISIDKVIQAQDSLYWKRDMLKFRLHLMVERGERCPIKRVCPSKGNGLSLVEKDVVRKSLEIQRESREHFLSDTREEFGKWFDTCYADRPWYITGRQFAGKCIVNMYGKVKDYKITQKIVKHLIHR